MEPVYIGCTAPLHLSFHSYVTALLILPFTMQMIRLNSEPIHFISITLCDSDYKKYRIAKKLQVWQNHTCISYILICKDLLTVDSCKKLLAKLLVARLAEKSKHVLLVALNTWLIEWILHQVCIHSHHMQTQMCRTAHRE